MKNIGIIAFADTNSGGVYQYTQSIIDALKNDTSNKYIIFCNNDDFRFDGYGLEVIKLNKPKRSLVTKIIMVFQLLLEIRKPLLFTKKELNYFKDIDLFISPIIYPYPHFYLNKPFIFTLHDIQEQYFPEFFTMRERFIRWLYNRKLAKTAKKILCESNYVKNDIVKFTNAQENKIVVIQSPPPANFLNFKFDEVKAKKIKQKYKLPEKFIFYPAQFWYHKNHIRLVEAFDIVRKKIDDVYLVLTGSQKNNFKNFLKKINYLKLSDKIKYLDYVNYEELPYLYKLSQFLIMPSLFESVSIPIYEAFSLEVAVCSSNVVALPEQVGDAGLLFDPYDVNEMAEKMMMYLKNEQLRKEKAELGFQKVKDFNHENYKSKLLEVLNAAL